MTLTVNGVDMVPYIANKGLTYQLSDIDSSDAGRTMDGLMHRGRVARKMRWDVKCRPLRNYEQAIVMTALRDEWLTVTYTDPETLTDVTKTMYTNNLKSGHLLLNRRGVEWWDGVQFPLIEQ